MKKHTYHLKLAFFSHSTGQNHSRSRMSQDFGIIFCGKDLDCSESDFWKELLGIVKQSASIQCSIFVHEKAN